MKLTPEEVFSKLQNDYKLSEQKGLIHFDLGSVGITVTQKDVVGNIMQEWLAQWLADNGIDFAPNPNTQMPPDFFLDPDDMTKNLLEVKAFNYEASPGFDIASFSTYYKEIIREPYMLHCKYLIFGYTMSDSGVVEIKEMWLKKVWEITSPMEDWPIKLQVKEGVVHKIRPAKWYASKIDYSLFSSLEDFISAMEETVYKNPDTHPDFSKWKKSLVDSYNKFYKVKLSIPKWCDIEDSYDEKKKRKEQKEIEKAMKAKEREQKRLERERTKAEKERMRLEREKERERKREEREKAKAEKEKRKAEKARLKQVKKES